MNQGHDFVLMGAAAAYGPFLETVHESHWERSRRGSVIGAVLLEVAGPRGTGVAVHTIACDDAISYAYGSHVCLACLSLV